MTEHRALGADPRYQHRIIPEQEDNITVLIYRRSSEAGSGVA